MRGEMEVVYEWRYLRFSWSRVQLGRRTEGEHVGLIWKAAWTEGDPACVNWRWNSCIIGGVLH
jgi:hypothetical protein